MALSGSRNVYTYIDEKDSNEVYDYLPIHDSEISCMVHLQPTLVVTSSSSGDILFRSIVNGQSLFSLFSYYC